ncbi:MAG TPA: iron-containing alcohol dehydrogenase [Candidatus Rifleibacterium sp.]|nr:iron-containing alcohol dehydrogenase [Candidatus Rifleibacterium sp.]HPT45001.1 iron-containing alcohol dehydrogenase [Candidatus Rifleibacterium sp.]
MNFEFQNPTHLIFGTGSITKLGEATKRYGKKALIVTGGGSVKRNGTFDKAIASLKTAGIQYVECSGIEPNPRLSSVIRGRDIARREKCDVIIALGGGSAMDAAKAIAAAVLYNGDPWDMFFHGQQNQYFPTEAMPLITIPTLAATGSEMNCGAVITNEESKIKSFVQVPCLYPKVALVDPELTVSVPKDQTAYGVCDIITHITEGYFNGVDDTPIQDRFAEGAIQTVLEYGPKAVENGNNIEARTQVQWASIVALNGWVQSGTNGGYPVHMIEHALSAHHDVTHGAGLAVVNPAWMRFAAKSRPAKFAQFARRVMGITEKFDNPLDLANAGIDKFEEFLKSIGCPIRLSELKIGDELFEQYAKDALQIIHDANGRLPGRPPMRKEDIVNVFRSAL